MRGAKAMLVGRIETKSTPSPEAVTLLGLKRVKVGFVEAVSTLYM